MRCSKRISLIVQCLLGAWISAAGLSASAAPAVALVDVDLSASSDEGRGCALVADQLHCWGGTAVDAATPGAAQLMSLAEHTPRPDSINGSYANARLLRVSDRSCVVDAGGLWCWGRNDHGQLGVGDLQPRPAPVAVSGLPVDLIDLAFGQAHSCALSQDQGVWCWGANDNGESGQLEGQTQLVPAPVHGLPAGVQAIALGDSFSCALVAGEVWCWGRNNFGQLGDGGQQSRFQPAPVADLPAGITTLAVGVNHVCAIDGAGAVWCWGSNYAGQSGIAPTQRPNEPLPVQQAGLVGPASGLHLDFASSCTIAAGAKRCWGITADGTALGATPTAVAVPEGAPSGWLHGCFDRVDQLVCPAQASRYPNTPLDAAPVPGITGATRQLALGRDFGCALLTDDSLWCWGDNQQGQLGQGDFAPRASAVRVALPPIQWVAAGTGHVCAASSDGGVWCWGGNDRGQLGDASLPNQPLPLRTVYSGVEVAAGHNFSCAAGAGGLSCWGDDRYGQASGSPSEQIVAAGRPLADASVLEISAGFAHACAVISTQSGEREAYCWGNLAVSEADLVGIVDYGPRLIDPGSPIPADSTRLLRSSAFTSCAGDRCYGFDYAPPNRGTPVVDAALQLPAGFDRDLALGGRLICAQGPSAQVHCGALTNRSCAFERAAGLLATPGQGIGCDFSESLVSAAEREWLVVKGLPTRPQVIGAGEQFACAALVDSLWCWGPRPPLRSTDYSAYTPVFRKGAVEPAASVPVALDSNRDCPAYLLSLVSLSDPGNTAEAGGWGLESLLQGGDRYLHGGLNFGGYGSTDSGGVPGYAGFSIANPNASEQLIALSLSGDGGSFQVSLRSLPVGASEPQVAFEETLSLGPDPVQRSIRVDNGYHVLVLHSLQGTELFLASIGTTTLDGGPAAFQGGAVVGGYIDGERLGFSAICTSDASALSLRSEARSSRGVSGAGDLRLQLRDGLTGSVLYDSE